MVRFRDRGIAQSGSASALGAEGRRFKSCCPDRLGTENDDASIGNTTMTLARIHRPAKTAMQSGTANAQRWLLEFVSDDPREIDPLMGWTSSSDTRRQVKLWFDTKEEAIAYATRNGIAHQVEEPKEAKRRTMSYSDNFKFNRIGQWTH